MADAAEEVEAKGSAGGGEKAGLPIVPLVLAILVAVIFSVGGLGAAGYWLVKSGRIPMSGGPVKVEAAEKAEPVKTRMMTLDPLLVNLADEGGKAYLRVGIVLRVEEPPPVKGKKEEKAEEKSEKGKTAVNESDVMMRDAALGVVGRETGEALLATDGKDRLKDELKAAMQARVPEVKVVDVLFTDFLVQR